MTDGAGVPAGAARPATTLPALPEGLVADGVALRPESAEDRDFCFTLYASTRWEELAPAGWPDEQKMAFLAQQFGAQTFHYDKHYTWAARGIVTVDGTPAGRLYLLQMPGDLRIVDIAMLPAWRGRGIGTALLEAVFVQARETGSKVSIHVEQANPAKRLYERLGFVAVDASGVYHLMERPAD